MILCAPPDRGCVCVCLCVVCVSPGVCAPGRVCPGAFVSGPVSLFGLVRVCPDWPVCAWMGGSSHRHGDRPGDSSCI